MYRLLEKMTDSRGFAYLLNQEELPQHIIRITLLHRQMKQFPRRELEALGVLVHMLGHVVGVAKYPQLAILLDLLLVFPIIGNELQSCIVFL